MKTHLININIALILFYLFNIHNSKVLKGKTIKKLQLKNQTISHQQSKQFQTKCNPFLNSVDIKSISAKTLTDSSSFPSKHYFLFFFSKSFLLTFSD